MTGRLLYPLPVFYVYLALALDELKLDQLLSYAAAQWRQEQSASLRRRTTTTGTSCSVRGGCWQRTTD